MSMILDGHTHVFPEEVCRRREDYFSDEPAFRLLYDSPKSKLVGPEEMVAAMDEAGVTAAVVMGFPWRREALWRRQHEVISEAMRRFPRRLIGFCAVHILAPGAAREVERCLAAGFRGVGELAWYEADLGEDLTAALAPIAELCAHYRAPLLLHTNDPVGPTYPGKAALSLPALYAAIQAFPGGGLDSGPLGRRPALLRPDEKGRPPRSSRRVYFDTAASPYLYRPQIYRLAAEMVGPDKIIFGSDYPLLPVSRYLKEMEDANLPEDWREMILGGNLARLLGI